MALVERLMGLSDDGSLPGDGYKLKIPVHTFFSACGEALAGRLTVAQIKSLVWLPSVLGALPMRDTPNDKAELDAIIALAPIASNPAGRALYLEGVHGVFMLAEAKITGYHTPALVRAKLGI
jgi:hypothetical protein